MLVKYDLMNDSISASISWSFNRQDGIQLFRIGAVFSRTYLDHSVATARLRLSPRRSALSGSTDKVPSIIPYSIGRLLAQGGKVLPNKKPVVLDPMLLRVFRVHARPDVACGVVDHSTPSTAALHAAQWGQSRKFSHRNTTPFQLMTQGREKDVQHGQIGIQEQYCADPGAGRVLSSLY